MNLLYIAIIVVYAIDVSGFYNEATSVISGWLTNGMIKKPIELKPFSCSLCMTFWVSVIYLLIVHSFTLKYVVLACLMSFITPVISSVLFTLRDALLFLINKINSFLCS